MLTRVVIDKFRSCTGVTVDNLAGILVLLGRNGVGKSNLLRAIHWAASASVSKQEDVSPSSYAAKAVGLEFLFAGTQFYYTISHHPPLYTAARPVDPAYLVESLAVNLNGLRTDIFRRDRSSLELPLAAKTVTIAPLTPSLSAITSLVPDYIAIDFVRNAIEFLGSVRYYPLEDHLGDDTLGFISQIEFEAWKSNSNSDMNANRLLLFKALDLSLNQSEVFSELKSLLGSDGLALINDITIQKIELPAIPARLEAPNSVGKPRVYYLVMFSPSLHPTEASFSLDDLSHGTRRILRLLIALLHDRSRVMLIEQPEDGIHSGLMHKLLPTLKAYVDPCQFLLASHSSEIFNRVLPSEVRLVDLKDGVTLLRALSDDEVLAAESYMEEDGPLSDYLESLQED